VIRTGKDHDDDSDYLRAHEDVAAEYQALERHLAQLHRLDREAYTVAKRPFINRITDVALDAGYAPKVRSGNT
jgi:hypothetical protein